MMRTQYFWKTTEYQFEVVYRWTRVVGPHAIHSQEIDRGGVDEWLKYRLDLKGNYRLVDTPDAVRQSAAKAKVAVPAQVWEQVVTS